MIKNFLISCACLLSLSAYTQQTGSVSPYSFFGIGDFRSNGTVENQMMGGLQTFGDSIHINLLNPAAYSKIKLTTYAAGVSNTTTRLVDTEEAQNISFGNLDYLGIAFPISKKAGVGFGLLPLSSVGYALNVSNDETTNAFTGNGGISRVFFSVGFEPIKNLSFGATINYNFGLLEYNRLQTVENVQFGTLNNRDSRVTGFDFNYAVDYTKKLNKKHSLTVHVGIDTQANLVSDNAERLGSFSVNNGQEIEVIDVDLSASNLERTGLKVPTRTTLGLGFGEDRKWFLGAEYSFQEFSSFENDFLGITNVAYEDANSVILGGFYIPNYSSFSSYLNRVTYRAGLRYDQTGLIVNNEQINNFGITFGFGLPLGNSFSNLNLGFELGRRGTTDAGLIEENYLILNLGLSLNDKWFNKRKIN